VRVEGAAPDRLIFFFSCQRQPWLWVLPTPFFKFVGRHCAQAPPSYRFGAEAVISATIPSPGVFRLPLSANIRFF